MKELGKAGKGGGKSKGGKARSPQSSPAAKAGKAAKRVVEAVKGGSIYAPHGSKRQQAHVKQDLTWVDNTDAGDTLTKVHAYDAPWAKNKGNWWARGMCGNVAIPLSFDVKPGCVRTVCFIQDD